MSDRILRETINFIANNRETRTIFALIGIAIGSIIIIPILYFILGFVLGQNEYLEIFKPVIDVLPLLFFGLALVAIVNWLVQFFEKNIN